MSTTGIDAHDGCHYHYSGGYELIGNHIFKLVERDLYGAAPQNNIQPPNIQLAYFSKPTRDEITLVMRNPTDTLAWQAGAEGDFRVDGITNSVLSGSISNNTVILQISPAATNGTTITYAGHAGPGAWVKNSSGVGLLCFDHQPVLTSLAPPINSRCYQDYVLSDGPLAYYRLGESTGAGVATNSGSLGSAANGIYSNTANGVSGPQAPTFIGMEYTNPAASFNGVSSYIALGNPAGLNFTGQITLEAWVKPFVSQNALADIIAHGVNAADNAEVQLRITDNARYEVGSWDGTSAHGVTFPIPSEDRGTWVHLAGTHDGTNWNLYRNGVRVAYTSDATGALLISDAGWAIGGRGWNGAPDRLFTGDLDEVAIYNYALSPSQVAAHYFAGKTGPLLTVRAEGGNVIITWPAGVLQQAADVAGSYTNVPGAISPHITPAGETRNFYRLKF